MSKTVICAVALGAASLFYVGYNYYFDRKPRSDPNSESDLRKKRLMTKKQEERTVHTPQMDNKGQFFGHIGNMAFPGQMNASQYFFQEVKTAASYMEQSYTGRNIHYLNKHSRGVQRIYQTSGYTTGPHVGANTRAVVQEPDEFWREQWWRPR